MKYLRTACFEIEADSLEEAEEMWEEDGPECGLFVELVDHSELEPIATPPPVNEETTK